MFVACLWVGCLWVICGMIQAGGRWETPRMANVTVTKIAGYVRVRILINRFFSRIFGIYIFQVMASLVNLV